MSSEGFDCNTLLPTFSSSDSSTLNFKSRTRNLVEKRKRTVRGFPQDVFEIAPGVGGLLSSTGDSRDASRAGGRGVELARSA
jgi:hypothetical protein